MTFFITAFCILLALTGVISSAYIAVKCWEKYAWDKDITFILTMFLEIVIFLFILGILEIFKII